MSRSAHIFRWFSHLSYGANRACHPFVHGMVSGVSQLAPRRFLLVVRSSLPPRRAAHHEFTGTRTPSRGAACDQWPAGRFLPHHVSLYERPAHNWLVQGFSISPPPSARMQGALGAARPRAVEAGRQPWRSSSSCGLDRLLWPSSPAAQLSLFGIKSMTTDCMSCLGGSACKGGRRHLGLPLCLQQ